MPNISRQFNKYLKHTIFVVAVVVFLFVLFAANPADAARAGIATPVTTSATPPIPVYNTTAGSVYFTGTAGPGDTVTWYNNLTLATGGVTPTHYFDCYVPWWDPCGWICDSLDSQTWSVTINVNAGANLIDFWTSTTPTRTQVTVNRDNTAPTIVITSPPPPSYSFGGSSINVSGTASDNLSGVASVRWYNGATGISGTASGTTSWTASGIQLQNGSNPIVMTATDVAGNVSSPVIVEVITTYVPPAGGTFVKAIGNSNHQFVTSMAPTSDGGYIIGSNPGSWAYLTKTDSSGAVTWTQELHGPYASTNIYSVIQTSDGGYATTGTANEWVGNNNVQLHIAKYTATGSLQWFRMASGANQDQGNAIIQTSDSGYMVVGQTNSFGAGGFDTYLLKYDSAGTLQWSKTYGTAFTEYGYDVKQTSDSGYIVVGMNSSYQYYIAKFDSAGNLAWSKGYTADGASSASVQITSDGGYISTSSYNIIKLDASGNIQWARYNNSYTTMYSAKQTSDGGYVATGYVYNGSNNEEMTLFRFNSSGALQWAKAIGATGREYGRAVSQMSDGGYAVAGYTNGFGAGGNDIYLARTDASGNVGLCGAVTASSISFNSSTPSLGAMTATVGSPATVASSPTSSVVFQAFTSVGGCAPDLVPPIRSGGYPMSPPPLVWSATNPRTITMGLTTNEKAQCKYSTSSGMSYVAMGSWFSGGGTTTHSASISISNGSSYTYYVKCQDYAYAPNANTNDYVISFSVYALPPIVGSCGTARGQSYVAPGPSYSPTTVLCAVGAVDPVSPGPVDQVGSQWQWTCRGDYGGADSPLCWANVIENGLCDPASDGQTFPDYSPPTALCSLGTATGFVPVGTTSWTWTCEGTGTGHLNDSCSATQDHPPVRSNGSPSTPNNNLPQGTTSTTISLSTNVAANCRYSTIANTDYLDTVNNTNFTTTGGTSHSVVVTGLANHTSYDYFVRCATVTTGTANGDDYRITFNVIENGVCGTSDGGAFSNPPTANLCNAGDQTIVQENSVSNLWTWDCKGWPIVSPPVANDDSCSASIIVNGICGVADGRSYPVSSPPPTGDLCTRGVANQDPPSHNASQWSWVCNGLYGGTPSRDCSALIPDAVPPTVTITAPNSGSDTTVTTMPISISGTASDDRGIVSYVVVTSDLGYTSTNLPATLIGGSPPQYSWNTGNIILPAGVNAITVIAYDPAGNPSTPDTMNIFYDAPDTTPPTVTITIPTTDSTYTSMDPSPYIVIGGTVFDNKEAISMSWISSQGYNGTLVLTGSGRNKTWGMPIMQRVTLENGFNTITVTATDAAGNIGNDVIVILYGFGGAENVGWISTSCMTGGPFQSNVCNYSDYKVNISKTLINFSLTPINLQWTMDAAYKRSVDDQAVELSWQHVGLCQRQDGFEVQVSLDPMFAPENVINDPACTAAAAARGDTACGGSACIVSVCCVNTDGCPSYLDQKAFLRLIGLNLNARYYWRVRTNSILNF
jgi:hypothetical protein